MIIDEAVHNWLNIALESEMRVLPLDEPMLTRLETLGFQRAVLPKAHYPKLEFDVPTLDFSGFPVYTHANVPDSIVTAVCAALEARKEKIIWQEPGPLPLENMCRDTRQGRSTSRSTSPPNDSGANAVTWCNHTPPLRSDPPAIHLIRSSSVRSLICDHCQTGPLQPDRDSRHRSRT